MPMCAKMFTNLLFEFTHHMIQTKVGDGGQAELLALRMPPELVVENPDAAEDGFLVALPGDEGAGGAEADRPRGGKRMWKQDLK